MWIFVLSGVLLVVAGFNWWVGTWNCFLNLVNFYLAAMVASSFFEPLADWFESLNPSYTYVVDFVAVWALFAATFIGLRIVTDILTRYQLRMNQWLDYGLRTLLSGLLAYSFVSFMFFTWHVAPLPPHELRSDPQNSHIGIGPENMWLALIEYASRGSLSESKKTLFLADYEYVGPGDDAELNARIFYPTTNFVTKYARRRQDLSQFQTLRVKR